MELTFLGRGAAFNSQEGNNSAYFTENNQLFLIDCGESIFERLIKNNILENIETINLLITHTHSDHIGSIGSLVLYIYYTLHKSINIIIPQNAKYILNLENILNAFGCTKEMYNYINETMYDNKYHTFERLRYIETSHCKELDSYGIIFQTNNGIVYYSGDTNETNIIKALITSGEIIDKIYIDTTNTNYPGNVHLYIGDLLKVIPQELKNRVYCMHLNNDDCISEALEIGFNVVENLDNKTYIKCKKTTSKNYF